MSPLINYDMEELFNSAKIQGSNIIEKYFESNPEDAIYIKNSYNQTLLHMSAGYGRLGLTTYLISHGANVNARDNQGMVPLHYACNYGHSSTAKKLIQAGAQIDFTDSRGWSALHFACSRVIDPERISDTSKKVITTLVESGAYPYLRSRSGRTCLSRINNKEVRAFVRLLHLDTNCTRDMIDKFLRVDDFFGLIKEGDDNLELLNKLITSKQQLVDIRLVENQSITPLHRAAGYNQLQVARLLLMNGAKVDAVDSEGRIPLHNAAQHGHLEMINLLVSERSDVNKQDHSGYSPLHLVALSELPFTVSATLIELGADRKLKCNDGKIPYEYAESGDVKEVLKPNMLRHKIESIPSNSEQRAIYKVIRAIEPMTPIYQVSRDELMLDSSSDERLFANTSHNIKEYELDLNDKSYQEVKKRMMATIMTHSSESGGRFSSYDILSIERILNEDIWKRYKRMCMNLEETDGFRNEKLLFHGSNSIDDIRSDGFDVGYAQRNGMFGAGIYFAEHSSKSNQYVFGWGNGCQIHEDPSCYKCERQMIYAQVALGRSFICKEAMPDCAHAPPKYSSVTGKPGITDNLLFPEYVIYHGYQAYPLFVIRYKIKK